MILFDLMRKRGRWIVISCAIVTVLAGPWVAFVGEAEDDPLPIASIVVLWSAVVCSWIGTAVAAWLWILWIPKGSALLRTQAWRPLSARVVRAGRPTFSSLVECDGETVLRVSRLTAAHDALIARTGRVWVVGPDDKGWASVRVDGSHAAYPARRVHPSREASGIEAGDVTALTAAGMRVRSLSMLRYEFAVTVWLGLLVATGFPLGYLGGFISAAVFMAIRRYWVPAVDRRLPALVAAADWCELPVLMNPWVWREHGTAKAEGTVGLPDGRALAVRMPNATVDLLGTIYERGTVWFSAPPERGKTVTVGFPGYPLLAVAVIR